MENKKIVEKAVIAGLFVEARRAPSIGNLLKGSSRKQRSVRSRLFKNLRGRLPKKSYFKSMKKRPHRLPPNWRDIAVDGWDSIAM